MDSTLQGRISCVHRTHRRHGSVHGFATSFQSCVTRNQRRGRTQILMVQTEDASASQENITGWPHGFEFQSCVRYVEIRRRDHTVQTTDARMEDGPPSRFNSWVKLHVPGPTHVAHEVACTPSSMRSLFQKLRIKLYLLHSYGIIINYYSQGLKPLSLAPLSNLSAPFSLPTMWKLSPPSLFLRGRSARSDV
jgi:hypothetical protein